MLVICITNEDVYQYDSLDEDGDINNDNYYNFQAV